MAPPRSPVDRELPTGRGAGGGLRRLLPLAREERGRLFLGTFFLALGSATTLAYPQIVRVIVDEAQNTSGTLSSGQALLNRAALLMVGIFGLQGVATAARYHLFTYAGERIVARLRQRLYRTIIDQEIGFFDGRHTGELISRLSTDTDSIRSAVSINISMALRGVAAVIGGTALLIQTSPKLSLVMLTSVPLVAISLGLVSRTIRRLARDYRDALAEATHVAEETIGGIRTVRAFSREAHESARYDAAVDRSRLVARRRIRIVSIFQGSMATVSYSSLGLVLWFGGRLMLEGAMSTGELTQFVLYTGMVALSLSMLTGIYADFMRAVGASDRVFELLDRRPRVPTAAGARLEEVRGQVRFEQVSFSYPTRADVEVLRRISFTIEPGERVALVGPSGGGKSTIAALLMRYYDPQEGRIAVDGCPLDGVDGGWWRSRLGVVSQEPMLFSTTVAENIGYASDDPSPEAIEAAARGANAHEFVLAFPEGYDTMVGERGVTLSGGQKQRVAIARALLRDPALLILDEATSALDAQSEHLVQEALERLMQGRTTVVIAHRLSTVIKADRVLVIDAGRLVEEGSHTQLMANAEGLYRGLVKRQFVAMHE